MKIRADYVTNSSSVSYVLTMNEEIADIYRRNFKSMWDQKKSRIFEVLRRDMIENGTRVMLEGKEMYSKKVTFSTDECMVDDSFEEPIEEVDFSKLGDEELWSYIYGEYIMNGRISEFHGLGSTQVETY
jgi:hypothetical protein